MIEYCKIDHSDPEQAQVSNPHLILTQSSPSPNPHPILTQPSPNPLLILTQSSPHLTQSSPHPHPILSQGASVGRCKGTVFAPAVLPPPEGAAAAKHAKLELSMTKIRVYSPVGGDETFALPAPWVGKTVHARAIGEGVVAPTVAVSGGVVLSLKGLPKASPVILTAV